MCGIVGYIGNSSAKPIILRGLEALEYRGYDSAGIALIYKPNKAVLVKEVGRVQGLIDAANHLPNSAANIGIGHTRWATHGKPSIANAHPQTNSDKTIFVVHNGIIENYLEIKAQLIKRGYKFLSETDTEVIPQLIDFHLKHSKSFEAAMGKSLRDLRGAYAVVAMYTKKPDTIYAARASSPLAVGVGKSEYIVASDPNAMVGRAKKVIFLEDNELAVITKNKHVINNFINSEKIDRQAEELELSLDNIDKGDYPTFMLKEIFEAPRVIRMASLGRLRLSPPTIKLGGLENVDNQLQHIDRLVIVACGTSYYAGLVGEYLIEELAGIPVEVQLASEFKYRNEPLSRSTVVMAISQSGETADTIAALKKVEDFGVLRLGVVNATGSSISRMTDAGVYCHAGPEQSVASTKAFVAQVIVLMLIALHLNGDPNDHKKLLKEIDDLPAKAEEVLANAAGIKKIALKYKNEKDFLFIGRKYQYPCALEGALKLKEISYIHAEGYATGEMKHGPLAMIDHDFPTFALVGDSTIIDKTYSNLEELRARNGRIVAIATKGNKKINNLADDVIYIPKTLEQAQPILMAIVMQLFAYYIAEALSLNVDRPRNLAKSVTVE